MTRVIPVVPVSMRIARIPCPNERERRRGRARTFVKLTFTADTPGPGGTASIARATSRKLIFDTWLLWSTSLRPSGAPSRLAKYTSSVSGTHTGASCANAKSGFAAIARSVAAGPRTSRKSGEKTWKKGGVVLVGLKREVKAEDRKVP